MHIANMNSLTDADLLLDLSEGNRGAFDILYNRYWKKVFNSAYKRVNDKEIAEDITQDIFVQLWIRGSKTLILDLPAYLFVAARNGVFKRMEKENKYTELHDTVIELETPFQQADAKILHREFINSFNRLVENLPEQQRIIFKLRFNESLSSKQIAEKLQISQKTVRNHIGRALATLKSEVVLFQLLLLVLKK
jgi:RNA polymerase sigma-70 factor (ECF subfamily)